MTDRTLQAIEVSRRIMRGEIVVELTRADLAHAIVELATTAPCNPTSACAMHGRCWTHSEWVDDWSTS